MLYHVGKRDLGVIKWKHFPRYWPFVRGIHRSPVNSPHKGQRRRALDFFFDLRLNKPLGKQSRGWWFETQSRSLWRHCNGCWHTEKCCLKCVTMCSFHIIFSIECVLALYIVYKLFWNVFIVDLIKYVIIDALCFSFISCHIARNVFDKQKQFNIGICFLCVFIWVPKSFITSSTSRTQTSGAPNFRNVKQLSHVWNCSFPGKMLQNIPCFMLDIFW